MLVDLFPVTAAWKLKWHSNKYNPDSSVVVLTLQKMESTRTGWLDPLPHSWKRKPFPFLPERTNTACSRHCCITVTGLQHLGLLSSDDLSTSLSDQCTTLLRARLLEHWSGGNATLQNGIQTRQLYQELLEWETWGCLQSSLSQCAGRMHPWTSQTTPQHSFSLCCLQLWRILTEWSRFVASPFPPLGCNFWQVSHPIWSLPPANRRQWEAVKVLSWTSFDKLQM